MRDISLFRRRSLRLRCVLDHTFTPHCIYGRHKNHKHTQIYIFLIKLVCVERVCECECLLRVCVFVEHFMTSCHRSLLPSTSHTLLDSNKTESTDFPRPPHHNTALTAHSTTQSNAAVVNVYSIHNGWNNNKTGGGMSSDASKLPKVRHNKKFSIYWMMIAPNQFTYFQSTYYSVRNVFNNSKVMQ